MDMILFKCQRTYVYTVVNIWSESSSSHLYTERTHVLSVDRQSTVGTFMITIHFKCHLYTYFVATSEVDHIGYALASYSICELLSSTLTLLEVLLLVAPTGCS